MEKLNYLNSLIKKETSRIELLKAIELKDNIFDKIMDSKLNDIEIIYFSSNPYLTEKNINRLFDFKIENANINLLKNSNCPVNKLYNFLSLNDKIYNIAIAHNENHNYELFKKLFRLNDFDVDITLSFNNSTPSDILKKLYLKDKYEINFGLSCNRKTPKEILKVLFEDIQYSSNISNIINTDDF